MDESPKDMRTDLGGKKNFHNRGVGGTYDGIAILSYYSICKEVSSFQEIEKMEEDIVLPGFKRLRFVNFNKNIYKKLMHTAFVNTKKQCDRFNDYKMSVANYEKDKPLYYEFTS